VPKWLWVLGGAGVALIALVVALVLWPDDPSEGVCCRSSRLPVLYAAVPGPQDALIRVLRADGRAFELRLHPVQGEYVAAGPEIGPARTGSICPVCLRTWLLSDHIYPEQPTRVRYVVGRLLRWL
jgi:hypothetical protein